MSREEQPQRLRGLSLVIVLILSVISLQASFADSKPQLPDLLGEHTACMPNGTCVIVQGSGQNQCLNDGQCRHRTCIDGLCKLVPGQGRDSCNSDSNCGRKACEGGACKILPVDVPNQSCESDQDCSGHLACVRWSQDPANVICRRVPGEGPDECSLGKDGQVGLSNSCQPAMGCVSGQCKYLAPGETGAPCSEITYGVSAECAETHKECSDEFTCEVKSGSGRSTCNDDPDCKPGSGAFTTCSWGQCVVKTGQSPPGHVECSSDKDCSQGYCAADAHQKLECRLGPPPLGAVPCNPENPWECEISPLIGRKCAKDTWDIYRCLPDFKNPNSQCDEFQCSLGNHRECKEGRCEVVPGAGPSLCWVGSQFHSCTGAKDKFTCLKDGTPIDPPPGDVSDPKVPVGDGGPYQRPPRCQPARADEAKDAKATCAECGSFQCREGMCVFDRSRPGQRDGCSDHFACGYRTCVAGQGCVWKEGEGVSTCHDDLQCGCQSWDPKNDCKHRECAQGSCELKDGEGPDQCDESGENPARDCKHGACSGEYCSLVAGEGKDDCDSDDPKNDCNHKECTPDFECRRVEGEGTDSCNEYQDCKNGPSHYACVEDRLGLRCAKVYGEASDECESEEDCGHLACKDGSCILVAGKEAKHECHNDDDCQKIQEPLPSLTSAPQPTPSLADVTTNTANLSGSESQQNAHIVSANLPSSSVLAGAYASSITWGDKSAPTTVTVFVDLTCGQCARWFREAQDILRLGVEARLIKVAFYHFPLILGDTETMARHRALWCANSIGQGAEFITRYMTSYSDFSKKKNVDLTSLIPEGTRKQFTACMSDPTTDSAFAALIREHRSLAEGFKVEGTPTVFFNNQQISNSKMAIEAQLSSKFLPKP